MSIMLAKLFIFVVFVAASFVHCINDGIDWDLYGDYLISVNDPIVGQLADFATLGIRARNPCYRVSHISAAAVRSGPNVNRYTIRLIVAYDVDFSANIQEGYMDIVADYPTVNNERGMFQIVSTEMRGWVRYRPGDCGNVDHCDKNPRRQYDH